LQVIIFHTEIVSKHYKFWWNWPLN